jgi:triacylglycerol lipase
VAVALAVVAASRPPAPSDAVTPVLLVHGYGGRAESMRTLERRLENEGRSVISVELPDRGEGDIAVSARALADVIRKRAFPRVDLVGFSAGGVVVRSYLNDADRAERARRVVLLGAPNHGAIVAARAAATDPTSCIDACAQLTPGSTFLTELNAGDETPGDALYVSIWTAQDEVVTPRKSAVLEGATNIRVQDICADADLDHGELVRDPLAVGLVVHALESEPFRIPTARDCGQLRVNS